MVEGSTSDYGKLPIVHFHHARGPIGELASMSRASGTSSHASNSPLKALGRPSAPAATSDVKVHIHVYKYTLGVQRVKRIMASQDET